MVIVRHACLRYIAVLLLSGIASSAAFAETAAHVPADKQQAALSFGYFPVVSTVALFKRFSPLRDYLADALGRPVELQTAKDFPTFMQRTDARNYDIVVTAPHFAVRAADSGKYVIRATLTEDVQQLFVVLKDSPIKSIDQLANKKIATPPSSALMTMMGVRFLANAGLVDDKQPIYRDFTSHNAANQALLAGEVDAAIASSNIVHKAIRQGENLRLLEGGSALPNMALMVASDLDAELGERITSILIEMHNSEKGQEVLRQIAFTGYRAVNARDYEPARPYLVQAVENIK